MGRASTVALIAGAAVCAGGRDVPGLPPDAGPPRSLGVRAEGRFSGAALGSSLGSEVHLFVADSTFAQRVYQAMLHPRVDQVADIATQQSPRLAVDPWARRVIAAQPLALRCR